MRLKEELCMWRERSGELASWTQSHLVNRQDAFEYVCARPQSGPGVPARKEPLSHETLVRHFRGANACDLIGIYTTSPTNKSRWAAITLEGLRGNSSPSPTENLAKSLLQDLQRLNLPTLLLSTDGQATYQLLTIFSDAVSTLAVYGFVEWLLATAVKEHRCVRGKGTPGQPRLSAQLGRGDWLPLPGRHPTLAHVTQVWSPERQAWLRGEDAVEALLGCELADARNIPGESAKFALPQRQAASSPRMLTDEEMRPINVVLRKLAKVQQSDTSQWRACCPAHPDCSPSLSVAEASGGKVLLTCHAGCTFEEIIDALGLTAEDVRSVPQRIRFRPRAKRNSSK